MGIINWAELRLVKKGSTFHCGDNLYMSGGVYEKDLSVIPAMNLRTGDIEWLPSIASVSLTNIKIIQQLTEAKTEYSTETETMWECD